MDLQEIRDYVRNHIDLEEEDLEDPLLDAFIREGSRRIEQAERTWPFYETFFTHDLEPGQQEVPFTAISSALSEIRKITTERRTNLRWIGIDEFYGRFPSPSETQGNVEFYSTFNGVLLLGPTPQATEKIRIWGYRKPDDWVGGGAGEEPDMPVELHNTIALWALQRAYAQQDDLEQSNLFERMFSDELELYRRRFTQMDMHQPFVLNGVARRRLSLRPPVFDWI